MTRRSYQQGYVSKEVRTRRGTAFKIRYRVCTTEGRWQHRSETLYNLTGRKAARAILDQRLRDASAVVRQPGERTFRDLVEHYWKPYLERKGVKPSTWMSYKSALELHLLPVFGNLRIDDVVPILVEQFLQDRLKSGLSAKTVRNLLVLLQGIFSLAVDNDLIPKSPVRNRHKLRFQRNEKVAWTPEQVRAIIDAAPPGYRALFVCAALTGIRLGELLGLQWKHVTLPRRQLRIEQSLWHGQLLSPKTHGSIRTIYFGDVLASALREHFDCATYKGPENFVFCKRDGSSLNPDVLRKDVLYPILDRLNILRRSGASGFHTFRHSAASFVNAQTGNLKLAQRLLGHSSITMTADVYTHTSAESEREAALAVERAIYGDLFPVVPNLRPGTSLRQ